jgi:hypothetical protein
VEQELSIVEHRIGKLKPNPFIPMTKMTQNLEEREKLYKCYDFCNFLLSFIFWWIFLFKIATRVLELEIAGQFGAEPDHFQFSLQIRWTTSSTRVLHCHQVGFCVIFVVGMNMDYGAMGEEGRET